MRMSRTAVQRPVQRSVNRSVRRRTRTVLVAVTVAGLLAGAASAVPAQADARQTETQQVSVAQGVENVPVPRGHGTLLAAEPLPEAVRLAGAGTSLKLRYTSADWAGRASVVSGTLAVPSGRAPAGGWPVVSFGHGFGGTADTCAPSRTGPSPMERAVQEALLATGHAVAVSDYAGIGTPGASSLIDGTSEGRNVVDVVLAARQAVTRATPVTRAAQQAATLSSSWAAVGYSLGGHAALFAGSLADTYAPSLRLTGTISMAGLTQLRMITGDPGGYTATGAVNPVTPFMIDGVAVTHPGAFRPDRYLTERGRSLVAESRSICLDAMATRVAGLTNADLYSDGPGLLAGFQRWYAAEEVPAVRYSRPVTLFHGLEDTIPAAVSQATAGQLAAAGSDVRFIAVPGADHLTLLPAIAKDVAARVTGLFTGAAG
ncbi:MAG: hypothetical protein QG622_2703 [Actinomycetota bacterium]|nr:hypothetical protein [Actinomycetota bacterium]